MAVARLKKVQIISPRTKREAVLTRLQKLGLIHLRDMEIPSDIPSQLRVPNGEGPGLKLSGAEFISSLGSIKEIEQRLSRIEFVLNFISRFEKESKGLVKSRPVLHKDEFEAFARVNFDELYDLSQELDSRLREIESREKTLEKESLDIQPWLGLGIPLEEIKIHRFVELYLGRIPASSFSKLKEAIVKEGLPMYLGVVNEEESYLDLLVVYLRQASIPSGALLKEHNFNYVFFPGLKGAPGEVLERIRDELIHLKGEKKNIVNEVMALYKERIKLMALYDRLMNVKRRVDISPLLLFTGYTFLLEGWIKARDYPHFCRGIEDLQEELEVIVSDPSPRESVPVVLENNRFIKPFEFLTEIYGLPGYKELDPTPFLAPFFFLFFGLCLSDAGYGLIMVLASIFFLKKFKMGRQGQNFFRLLLYCGLSTILIGALTGGWFGDMFEYLARAGRLGEALKRWKDAVVVLDPQREPIKLLIIALCLGVIQVWVGNLAALYGNLRQRNFRASLLDQGSILLFLAGFTGTVLARFGILPQVSMKLFLIFFVFGSVFIVFTQGRTNPGVGSKLFFGIYNLYNSLSGYFSDVLSYCRLWALGLVSGVMASTCNLIAIMLGKMVPLVGFILTVLILVAGHIMTLLMNILGAFIHPARLQFVEFFPKFFKGGGIPFRPLREENRYITVKN